MRRERFFSEIKKRLVGLALGELEVFPGAGLSVFLSLDLSGIAR